MTSVPGSIPRIIQGLFCKELNLNKNTKIWLNSLIGIAISALLLYSIWLQIHKQLSHLHSDWWQGETIFLVIALLLMPVNLSIEAFKWKLLAGSAQPLSAFQAWKSYLAGIALSLITPNRIGEYPGRLLYLKRKNTVRLISVSVLGVFAQFFTLFIYGIAGLLYYNIFFPGYWQQIVLVICAIIVLLLSLIFFRFENWIVYFENIKWLRRFHTYGQLMKRFTMKEQCIILGLSLLRFSVYTVQYLMLLHWMHISLPAGEGFLMASLYFWSIAVIPSIAFTELGVRGHVSLFLFHHFTENTVGILVATIGLWCMNLIIPAIIGSILLMRIRIEDLPN